MTDNIIITCYTLLIIVACYCCVQPIKLYAECYKMSISFIYLQVKHTPGEKKPVDTELMGDQGSKRGTIKSVEEILNNGGCKVAQTIYENGQDWHPVLPSLGEQKCIKCACKVIYLYNTIQLRLKNIVVIQCVFLSFYLSVK